jgi:PAS domain S-box-containing protein
METLDRLPCAALITDATGRVLTLNGELQDLLGGVSREAVLGLPMDNLLTPDSRTSLQTHAWPMLAGQGRVAGLLLFLEGADGRPIPVMAACKAVGAPAAEAFHWLFHDAEERTRFEQELLRARNLAEDAAAALRRPEQFLRTITDAIPSLVSYWDRGLRCRFANRVQSEWFEPRPLIGIPLAGVWGEALWACHEDEIRGVLGGSPSHSGPGCRRQHHRILLPGDGCERTQAGRGQAAGG